MNIGGTTYIVFVVDSMMESVESLKLTCWFSGQHECTAIDNAVLGYIPLVPWSGTPLNTSLVSPLTVAFRH